VKRPPKVPKRQATLFPVVVNEEVFTPEAKARSIAALADLLLEACGLQPERRGADDEQQDLA
jgi:hypothetical protein